MHELCYVCVAKEEWQLGALDPICQSNRAVWSANGRLHRRASATVLAAKASSSWNHGS